MLTENLLHFPGAGGKKQWMGLRKIDAVALFSMSQPEDASQASESSLPLKPHAHRRKRSRSRLGSSFRGKLSLIAMFFILRALDVFIYFEWPGTDKSALLFSIINNIIWTTALLAAVWFRKGWARYVLILFLPLGVLSGLILLPDFWIKFDADNRVIVILSAALIVNATVAWFLMFSRDLDRLTGRGHA
jgi:hypothetical protein